MDALFFKSTSLHEQQPLQSAPNRQYVERPCKSGLMKVVEFVSPFNQIIVYWDLKIEDFAELFSKNVMYSSRFFLGGEGFFLICSWEGIDRGSSHICFRLVSEKKPTSLKVTGEFAARRHPYKGFVSKYRGNVFGRNAGESSVDLFSKEWGLFLAESNPYFINGVIHLRLELTLLNNNLHRFHNLLDTDKNV